MSAVSNAPSRGFFARLALRWLVCSLGLWIAAGLFSSVSYESKVSAVLVAGLLLAIINAVIKPILVIASLPAILLTLGLFMLVINGLTVWLVSEIYSPLRVSGFGGAILTGVVIGLVNYLVTAILEDHN